MSKQMNWNRIKANSRISRYGAEAARPNEPYAPVTYCAPRAPAPKRPRKTKELAAAPLSQSQRAAAHMERADKALSYHDRLRAIRFVHRARVALDIEFTGMAVADALA